MDDIAVLGSTGSIGENTLQVVRAHPHQFRVRVLAAKKNVEKLIAQAREFRPEIVCLYDPSRASVLEHALRGMRVRVVTGDDGLKAVSVMPGVKKFIFAMVGACGLAPLFSAIRAAKDVAIANKEPLVMAGRLLMEEAARSGASVLPIDSEHSGLWQCLAGHPREAVKKLILTSSGGPFRKRRGSFDRIRPEDALKHPKWKMGSKITIDSATLMNKGLEVIEAANLFGIPPERIEVLIHPEAIMHALVEFTDGSHLAHLGITDMRLPIQYALSYPRRLSNHLPSLDLSTIGCFHFEKPDLIRFPCLRLGYEASRAGGTMPTVLNAANEIAVAAFLSKRLKFTGIASIIEKVMEQHHLVPDPTLSDIFEADRWAREVTEALICKEEPGGGKWQGKKRVRAKV